ncbi:MAG TPA: hypothetical protein VK564_13770, partial [Thermodesulfobacteriota bacterium]|nr:hypothetical protein [Thermodesulfobacteriota bacterium]
MAPAGSIKIGGKKFMWDGMNYESRDLAEAALGAYRKEGFEGEIVADEGRCLVYTRRVVGLEA